MSKLTPEQIEYSENEDDYGKCPVRRAKERLNRELEDVSEETLKSMTTALLEHDSSITKAMLIEENKLQQATIEKLCDALDNVAIDIQIAHDMNMTTRRTLGNKYRKLAQQCRAELKNEKTK